MVSTLAVAPASALKVRFRRPATVPMPQDDLSGRALAELGRTLFFDASLSADGTLSCATCHRPELGWSDGRPRAVGRGGATLARRTPPIVDLAWAVTVLWDGRMDDVDSQAVDPIRLPQIGNRPLPELTAAMQRDEDYPRAFAAAFGDRTITPERIGSALGAFERSLVSPRSAFDAWIEGDETAIGEDAKRGFAIFNGAGHCGSCHDGWRFTDDGFHDIGLAGGTDRGRGTLFPHEPTLQHAFKTPTLRRVNVDGPLAGPFMHDGSLTTLDDVLTHYASSFVHRSSLDPAMQAFGLSAQDRHDLTAFVGSINAPVAAP